MPTPYQDFRLLIRDGDVAAFRRDTWAKYTHIGLCVWFKQVLMLAEVREFYGGRIVTLSSEVARVPGIIDIYRPNCERNVARLAAEYMVRQAGHRYGWGSVWTAIRKRLLLSGRSTRWSCRDTTPTRWSDLKHCSQTGAWVFRKSAKVLGSLYFPCEGVSDKCVEPTPLIESVDSRGVRHFELAFEGLMHRSAMK
jgi:hypothetical protein